MWIGVLPSVWSVVINVFMLLVPWQIKRLEKGEGRLFAMLFSIGNRISVVLAYLPPSLGAVGLAFPLLLGFYVWEFFMLVAAAQFMRTLWGDNWGYAPATFLTLLLFCLPILGGEWKLAPSRQSTPRSLSAEVCQ